MGTSTSHAELNKLVNTLKMDDYVWLFHLINREKLEYELRRSINDSDNELIQEDVRSLNILRDINDVKSIVINKGKELNEKDVQYLIDDIHDYLESLSYRSHDLSRYKSDKRFLNFALYKLTNKLDDDLLEINKIQDDYLRFLYIISVYKISRRTINKLLRFEKFFSNLLLDKTLHFKNYDNADFYKWSLKYILEDKEIPHRFNFKEYSPIQDDEFKVVVLSLLDQIYDTDENTYLVLKDKISNAWYQKAYRKKNKGRDHHYFFTDKTLEALETISKKENISEEKVLERLINEYFINHCTYQNSGEHKYSKAIL